MGTVSWLISCCLIVGATSDVGTDPSPVTIAAQAQVQQDTAPGGQIADRQAFHRDLVGIWRAKAFRNNAWVDLIWVVGNSHAWHVVTAYRDEALEQPLIRWDLVREYRLEQRSALFPDAYELQWNDHIGRLTSYEHNPALYAAIGVDDCELSVGIPRDLSTDNCGAPTFPFRDCAMMDFVELRERRMTFGDPTQGDRCGHRPTRYEAWAFDRVALTPELIRRLFP